MDNQFLHIEPRKDTEITPKRHIEPGTISKAIYMVTESLDESEPIKKALRTVAIELITIGDLKSIHRLQDTLTLGADTGCISKINVQILLEAMSYLKYHETSSEKTLYIEDMFTSQNPVPSAHSNTISLNTQEGNVSHIKDQGLEDVKNENTPRTEKDSVKTKDSPFAHIDEKPAVQKSAISTVIALDIGARRKKILEVVKSKGQATIHEFIQSIQGCSSKTIQRELTSLVLSGTLKKTGERRWSKYSMR